MTRVIVIGAGVAGLTAAALLLKKGMQVTVLEAGTYPGGCAGTFYHKGYRFDAGATLAGGFSPGGPHDRVAQLLGLEWPVEPIKDAAWTTHLPGSEINHWVDPTRWQEEVREKLPGSEPFWQKQEKLAKIGWEISSRHFPWPPVSPKETAELLKAMRPETLLAAPYLFSSAQSLFPKNYTMQFKTFVDAALLISAQAVGKDATALYASSALDLPRRGVMHVRGGMGAISDTLVSWIRSNGGEVKFKQKVFRMETMQGKVTSVITQKGEVFRADVFLANITPWGLENLLSEQVPPSLKRETASRPAMWGAFVLHAAVRADVINQEITHHQGVVDMRQPLGEGNSVFISLSPLDDSTRAPAGFRTATLTTHTRVEDWQELYKSYPTAYEEKKADYATRLISAAEQALPGFSAAIVFSLPGSPHTYQRYTHRPLGMVGGFPQTSLFTARGPQTGFSNLWLVGDSIFPGQSTAAVTLGAMRVSRLVAGPSTFA